MTVPFIESLTRSEEDKSIVRFGFSHFGSTAGAARSVSDHLKIEIGSVGSERSRSLAGRLARFVTDKTLLLSESGNLVCCRPALFKLQRFDWIEVWFMT